MDYNDIMKASNEVRVPSTSEAEKSFGLDEAIEKLEDSLSFFGSESVVDQIHNYVDDFVLAEKEFAERVRYFWVGTAPWNTTNLEQSIKVDDEENYPKSLAIGVDVDALLAHEGRWLKSIRAQSPYKGGTVDPDKIPGYDYTDDANKNNVSSRKTPNSVPTGGEFVMSVWFEYFKKAKREVFG